MKTIKICILVLAALCLLTSCNNEKKESNAQNLVEISGVYTKNAVPLDDDFTGIQTMTTHGDNIYLVGSMKDGDEYMQTMAVYNTSDSTVSYETLPVNISFNNASISDFGELFMAVSFDDATFKQIYSLYCIKDGNIYWEKAVSDIISLPEMFWGNIYIASDTDNWYVGGDTALVILSPDGTVVKKETMPETIDHIYKDNSEMIHITGTGYHYTVGESGNLIDNAEWQKMLKTTGSEDIFFGQGYDFYYTTETDLIGYNIVDGTTQKLMNWVNSGLVATGSLKLAITSPETIYYYGSDGIGGASGLWKYTKADNSVLSEKTLVHVTYMEDGRYTVPTAAVKFNASQNKYQITCEEYSSSHSSDSYAVLLDGLDAAILSGTVGDIVVLNDMDSISKYARKNALADLYTLMTDEFSADDIFGCVREACEIKNKLYALPQEFTLQTYAAKTENLPHMDKWDTGALIELGNILPENQKLFQSMTKSNVYSILRDSAIAECIDFTNNTSSFTSASFINFMEYVSSLPEIEASPLEYGQNYYITDAVLLYQAEISSYASYAQVINVFGEGEDVSIIGYPSSDGGAAKINADKYYAIMESSNVKEGAMAFLRYLLSAESTINENRGMRSIPALKTTMQAWNDSEGKMYYYFYTYDIGRWSGDSKPITREAEGEDGVCVAIDQKLIDEVYAFFDNVNVSPKIPDSVIDIVEEEMKAYFAGSKTADETAKLIENRVNIYLGEQG